MPEPSPNAGAEKKIGAIDVRRLWPVLVLWLLAAAQHFWITPQLERLPADYAEETSFAAHSRFRETPTSPWVNSTLTARRVDQTLMASASHAIIQGDLHWTNDAGVVEYENTGVYGVDRYTRMNLPGYGDVVRTGPFLFPLHTQPTTYRYWDPLFIGGRVATYERASNVDGVPVYVFRFTASALDESAGYSQLPDVPQRYRVHTDGHGTMWIEPVSGIVVDYEEQGISYFVEPATGKRIAEFYLWNDRYTQQTRSAKVEQAVAARRWIMALEIWAPAALLLAGLAWLVVVLRAKAPQHATAISPALTGEPS